MRLIPSDFPCVCGGLSPCVFSLLFFLAYTSLLFGFLGFSSFGSFFVSLRLYSASPYFPYFLVSFVVLIVVSLFFISAQGGKACGLFGVGCFRSLRKPS